MSEINFNEWPSAQKIDPRLLEIFSKKQAAKKTEISDIGISSVKERGLGVLYAMYMGVTAMILSILLGTMRGDEQDIVLTRACLGLLSFFVIGFVAGKIAEFCVHESAKSLLRDVISRTELQHDDDQANAENGIAK